MISKGQDTITIKDLREVISDDEVASKYLNITSVPILILSPLRKEKNPSVSIFRLPDGNIGFKDFGTNEKGTIYDLLSKIWNISKKQVYRRILKDNISSVYLINKTKSRKKKLKTNYSTLNVKIREWKSWDIEFWESFGISLEWLKFGDVYPISTIFINENKVTIPAEKYAYVYVERKDNKVTLKIYQPYSTNYKWMSKNDSSVWDLWTKIPEKGDKLIITSSRKDALCVWENTGIPAISLQGEGYIPKESVINELKSRFTDIYILYDNDFQSEENHGRIYGKHLSTLFGLKQIEIPDKYKSKDPSDLCKNYGREVVKTVILTLLNI